MFLALVCASAALCRAETTFSGDTRARWWKAAVTVYVEGEGSHHLAPSQHRRNEHSQHRRSSRMALNHCYSSMQSHH